VPVSALCGAPPALVCISFTKWRRLMREVKRSSGFRDLFITNRANGSQPIKATAHVQSRDRQLHLLCHLCRYSASTDEAQQVRSMKPGRTGLLRWMGMFPRDRRLGGLHSLVWTPIETRRQAVQRLWRRSCGAQYRLTSL
jgi:hypothetical protein